MPTLRQFRPKTLENRAALRTAIAALLAVLLAFKFHLETPYWSGMTVVITANLYTGSVISKALMRVIGTIAGAVLGFVAAGFVVNSFLLYLLTSFLLVAVAVYYYNLSNYAYAWLLGALTALIIISQLAVDPQSIFYVAVWRCVEIALGVLVASLSALTIFPNPIKKIVGEQFDALLADLAKNLQQFYICIMEDCKDVQSLAEANLQLKKSCRKVTDLIGAMPKDPGIKKETIDRYRALLELVYQLTRWFQYQINQPISLSSLPVHLPVKELFDAVEQDLSALRAAMKGKKIIPESLQLSDSIRLFEEQFKKMGANSADSAESLYALNHFMRQVEHNIADMKLLLQGSEPETQPSIYINARKRLRNDPDMIKHCLKAGVTVLLALLIWLASSWPGGLKGIISSIIISVRKNLYEMKNVSTHRFIGCFLGGGSALISLSLLRMDLFDFIFILSLFVWLFSFFSFKYPQYAYIGLQANIALIITLAQGGGPPVELAPPLERLAGILMGIFASFTVGNVLWRADAFSILQRYLKKLFYYLRENIQILLLDHKESAPLHDLTNLFWISRGLIEALMSEKLSEKKQEQLASLQQRFEHFTVLQATVSYARTSIDIRKARALAMHYALPLASVENGIADLYQEGKKANVGLIEEKLHACFTSFRQTFLSADIADEDRRHLMAYLHILRQVLLKYTAIGKI